MLFVNSKTKTIIRKIDWTLILAVIILTSLGLSAIYSVDLSRGQELYFFHNQLNFFFLSIFILGLTSYIHFSFYEAISPLSYVVSLILLIGVLFFGSHIRGTTGWFRIGNIGFQPAELTKLSLILFLSWRIARQARNFRALNYVLVTGIIAILPILLILKQPDLGSASILGGVWFGYLLLSKTKKRYILSLILLSIIGFLIAWFFLFKPYQKERILTFINPNYNPLGSGYNVSQSIIAIGSGKIFGRGLGFGSQSQLHFLPEAHTDFIFSVIGEELGLIGCLMVLSLYLLIFWRLINILKKCQDDYSSFVVSGVILVLILQIIINIGATLGILPVTGVTLPFLSYGGSSLLVNYSLIGLVESANKNIH